MGIGYRSVLKDIDGAIVDSITITTQPTKTIYIEGQSLDLTGLKVSAVVPPLSGDVTSHITTVPANGQILTSNITDVIVRYGNATTTIPISVCAIDEIVVTSQPDSYLIGDVLNLTNIVVTGYANNKTISKVVTSECTFDPPEGTILNEEKTYTVSVSYNNLNTSFNVACQVPVWDSRGLEYNSWKTIAWYIRNGQTSGKMSIGNTKNVTINGVTVPFELVSINTGANQYYPSNTADFIAKKPINENGVWYAPPQDWSTSVARQDLNGSIYDGLESGLKNSIVEKSLPRVANLGGDSFTSKVSSDKLWLPAASEVASFVGKTPSVTTYETLTIPYQTFTPSNKNDTITSSRARPGNTYNENNGLGTYWITSSGTENGRTWAFNTKQTNMSGYPIGYTTHYSYLVPGFRIG